MQEGLTFAVTFIKGSTGFPTFEVGAYRYTGAWLPFVGDIITITRVSIAETDEPRERLAYVTRVDPTSDTPIRATDPTGVSLPSVDDYIVNDDYIVTP
jgi:hypothetical protein